MRQTSFILRLFNGVLFIVISLGAIGQSAGLSLAPTPPMGWNSWNAFEVDINEAKIKEIADAMVSSGMRDAGYKYLVIDDAWMAPQRDSLGNLVADPNKFPSGMKAIGDYIHSKGLKFGIYECRGYLTCQKLPGSFQHEQADMNSFASWGVDYIKLDACFAEKNGRLSSEEFKIYSDCIKRTGRPMLLSISDFGMGAWTWGGKEYAQLWRTSFDIYPFMESVYEHANSSGGSGSIHPAFNGLWQFAGPGFWNDPDLMEVGNLKNQVEDKAHFSLWSILAAPLMASNDLRSMSEQTKTILTAPEIIAVNQDVRGHQGFKISEKDSTEVYAKPLSDGTVAVLLLNKGTFPREIKVNWSRLGLKGKQKVRDLWQQKDIGFYKKKFSTNILAKDELQFVKVGIPGSPQVQGPSPLAIDKYAITKRGTTYISDLFYIMKSGEAPVYNKNYSQHPLSINGVKYNKGLGCKSKSQVMFKLDGKASRLKADIGLDDSYSGAESGVFRIYNEDYFGNKTLFDSKKMNKQSKTISIDIDVKGIEYVLLEFTGNEVMGNWGNIRVEAL
jgi:hypothetical protein